MLVLLLMAACEGDCDRGAPSFYVETYNENEVFIEDIEVEFGKQAENEGDQVNMQPCTLSTAWECGSGAPGTYVVTIGGPGWMRQRKHIDVPQPIDECVPERPTMTVTVVPEED